SGEKNNDLPGDSCSETLSQTIVIEKPHDLRARPGDFPGPWFSITALECDFPNQPLGDGFREGKMRWKRGFEPSSLVFPRLLAEDHPTRERVRWNPAPKGPQHISPGPRSGRRQERAAQGEPRSGLCRPFRAGRAVVAGSPGRGPGLVGCGP